MTGLIALNFITSWMSYNTKALQITLVQDFTLLFIPSFFILIDVAYLLVALVRIKAQILGGTNNCYMALHVVFLICFLVLYFFGNFS